MYCLTLELNQICNLNCSYCYLGEKDGARMDFSIAKKSIAYAIERLWVHRDRTIMISFIGGEPLLEFELLEKVVFYIEKQIQEKDIKIIYSVTTNGTVFTREIVDFLMSYHFILKVSLDGDKQCNDRNRKAFDHSSVHDLVVNNLPLLKSYYLNTGNHIQVTNVITPSTYAEYFETLKYLANEMNFKVIDTAYDIDGEWKQEEMEKLFGLLGKSFKWYMEKCKSGNGFYWSFFRELQRSVEKKKKVYSCGGGIVSIYVRTNGESYPCCSCFKEKMKLGNMRTLINEDKINHLRSIKSIENGECQSCSIYDYCGAKGCIAASFEKNQNENIPNKFLCEIQKFMYVFYMKNQNIIALMKDNI